ncbi:uncharacterized protein EV154DRAFT_484628 [Mucor mucedo]|uniref:uncharacterized protein n=1 Tax=Mucor mucedo TaxID=29922 RepID=UPI0022208C4B|nr:uncharacterized protein EV154DRAFT_484628 [Mucor mucedo]KAI7887910.1 hypothetical protein EV154DRAFT_484628 [Mucor mucedo]
MSGKRPLPSPSTSGTARKNVRSTDPKEGLSDIERARKMQEFMSEVSSLRKTIPPDEGSHLSLQSKVSYKENEDTYTRFIGDINLMREYEDPPQPPLESFTQFSFNIDMLKNYIISRSLLEVERVENKMQLGTMIRETTHLVKIAQRKNPKLQLEENFTRQLHNYMYRMSTVGYFGRKEPRAVFGRQELLIIVNNLMKYAPISGNINFEYQIIIYFLIIMYTGIRPSSLTMSVKHTEAKYLQWKHVSIWRGERDDDGFKIHVVIQIPHLKGRGNYFTESNRPFRKTFTSTISPDIPYERNLDVAVFICALAFRRRITTVATPQEWYESNAVLLQLKESCAETPVFVKSSLFYFSDQENENAQPLTSDSAEHIASRAIRNAGMNIQGTLYSFRRNFAQIINDNLSNSTAPTLMVQTPSSLNLKKAYAGRFEQIDMTRLVTTGEATQSPTIDPMMSPAAFHIKDISRYYLTEEEERDDVDTDERVQHTFNTKETFVKNLMKKYGSKARKHWSKQEKQDLEEHNRKYEQARRVVFVRLTRVKLLRLYGQVNQALRLNDQGVRYLDEESIDIPKRPLPNPAESITDEEDVEEESEGSRSDDQASSDHEDAGDDEDKEEVNTEGEEEQNNDDVELFEGEDEWEEYVYQGQESDSEKEEEELTLEEDQVSDYIISSQERTQEPPNELEVNDNEKAGDRLRDRRYLNLIELVNLHLRPTGKSQCQWCVEQNFHGRDFSGYSDLVIHLYEGLISRYSWVGRRVSGRHANSERWFRAHLPVQRKDRLVCSVENCDYSVKTKQQMVKHIREKHLEVLMKKKIIVDASPVESAQLVQDYLQEHYQYTMPDEERDKLHQKNDERRIIYVRRRAAEKGKDTTKDNGKGKGSTRKKVKGKDSQEGKAQSGIKTRAQTRSSNVKSKGKEKS